MRLLLLLLLLATTACKDTSQNTPAAAPQATQSPVLVTAYQLPAATPKRIVSLAPNITELLFAMGLGDRVVGVTRYCDWPPEAAKLPKIGGFVDPDMEAILSKRPDLVLGMTSPGNEALPQALGRAHLPHAFLRMDDTAQTIEAIELLGGLLHRPEQGARLAGQLRAGLKARPARAGARSALFVLGHDPIVVAGVGTFGHELLALAGLTNAASALPSAYPVLDAEGVLSLAPAIILDATMTPEQGQPTLEFWKKWSALPAVKDGRVYRFSDPSLLRPGPRLPEALRHIEAALDAPAP
jgi:iron complex transport system substrate-binding protein